MNIFNTIKKDIIDIVNTVFVSTNSAFYSTLDEYCTDIVVEFPNNPEYGDISTNIAMVLAKPLRSSPRAIAEKLLPHISMLKYIKKVEIAGSGFINMTLNVDFWINFIKQVIILGESYGDNNIGGGEKVNIEYVSANPTGPLHIGHARGAIVGDAMASILSKCGYDVTREYYINDSGKQIDRLVESFFIRYKQELGINAELGDDHYPGQYLVDFAKEFIKENSDKYVRVNEREALSELRSVVVDGMMKMIRDDLKLLKIQHDIFTSEQHDIINQGKLNEAMDILNKANLLYRGILDKPKGEAAEDWEPSEQLIMKTTLFGDETDRPILRSDGSTTYFSSDIAYHYDKIKRGFSRMIVPLGADHIGYAKRLEVIVDALSNNCAKFKVLIMQMVNLLENGKSVKMSKRTGNFLTLRDVIEELGSDILRFSMLMRKSDTIFDLDFIKIREQSKDNLLFYIQYAHTRCVSVLNNAYDVHAIHTNELAIVEESITGNKKVSYICNINIKSMDLTALSHDIEISLIKKIALFPRILENSAINYEPHRIVYYLYDLAHSIHQLWVFGNNDRSMRFIQNDNVDLTRARIVLVYTAASVIGNALTLLSIHPMLEM